MRTPPNTSLLDIAKSLGTGVLPPGRSGDGGGGGGSGFSVASTPPPGAILPSGAIGWLVDTASHYVPYWTSVVDDPDFLAWYAQILAAGGTASSGTQSAVRDFIVGCKADSIWDLLLDVGPLCGDSLPAALVKLKHLNSWVYSNHNFGAGDYSQDTGLAGGSSAMKWLGSSVLGTDLTLGSTGLGVYNRSTASGGNCVFGAISGDNRLRFYAPWSDNILYSDQYDDLHELPSPSAISGALGWMFATRDGGGNHAIYRKATQLATTSVVGGSLPGSEIQFYRPNGDTPGTGAQTLAFLCITAGMNATQAAALYARVQAFQTALGRQV
jgi:hypothetical protein